MTEIVYVLINESMDSLVKIGRTTTSIEQRIRELDNTSVPLPFQCFYAAEVTNSTWVEEKLHKIFADKRIRNNREFFRADPNQVKAAVELAELNDITPKDDIVIGSSDIQALQKAVIAEERRTKLKFTELGIPIGAQLTFIKDRNIVCTVVTDGKVQYEDQILSQSAAALQVLHKMGYQWVTARGSNHWEYEGETLLARRIRLEDEQ